ncbi:PQQ-binding-like beta-propeller repeat protein [Roseiconus nitratireducens]|uniref:PQQ-binding-like beta-propeller repeat protein n=1 Tax=Roseiconus nitratireducens TaxID=2605748 RepID=A0A5M6D260_9BACT|nr:PQQ-binding-like beta-propeller repeat protein [Roseiconus nitratireducens]KAA5541423.1 PQQ-binding-like beta-propeller repeat protein [Roseiconus nitratireducens]
MKHIIWLSIVCLLVSPLAAAENWLGFRGDGRSYAPQATPPASFDVESGENVAWKVPTTGRGIGGPLVIGDQVIVTGCGGEDERDLYVESYATSDGSLQWSRPMRATGRPFTHPTSSNASPTPASDGERIFALFSSCDLICYDLHGHLQWYRALAVDHPKTGNDISMSSSPVVVDGVVVVQLENQGDSFAAGIDAKSGEVLWENQRSTGSNWSSPQPVQITDDRSAVAMHNGGGVDLLDVRSGDVIQHFDVSGDGTASSTFAGPYLIVPGSETTAIRIVDPEVATDQPLGEIQWESNKLRPSRVSPVVSDQRIYMGKGSVLMAGSLSDGSVLWQARLGRLNNVWATPVLTGTGIYIIGSDGKVVVVADRGDEGEVIGESELGQNVLASPAVAGDSLYIRSEQGLVRISE